MTDSVARAARFNRDCDCMGADVPALQQRLDATLADGAVTDSIVASHPHLFSGTPVFLAREHSRQMQRVIASVGAVAALPAYREEVLGRAPAIARPAPRCHGVFFGFDFHIAADGPKLIEINSNAGGALLNIEMRRAQQACCEPAAAYLRDEPGAESLQGMVVDMFLREWRLARGGLPLRTIAIVDDAPEKQYLYPEFRLIQKLFAAHGLRALIVDAKDLVVEGDALLAEGEPIDLVYNRSTDFYFTDPAHAALACAYGRDLAVITPHPHAHALFSNKLNLVLLSDAASLQAMGAAAADIEVLGDAVPSTRRVGSPEALEWADRKQWFFKPAAGFGSRGTYRGDKITRRAFDEVMRGDYIAQRIAPPSER
ncbi:MAG TPA: hypothetical protein VFS58_00680, partial [Steroidobacteraceae bacterium]|nr:hypothetical protein [Steroidobacteraceae bacterium]